MAGLVPGLLSAAMYMGGIYTIAKNPPRYGSSVEGRYKLE